MRDNEKNNEDNEKSGIIREDNIRNNEENSDEIWEETRINREDNERPGENIISKQMIRKKQGNQDHNEGNMEDNWR